LASPCGPQSEGQQLSRAWLIVQDIFEEQSYIVATLGLHDRSTLSTNSLVHIVDPLISDEFFRISTPDTPSHLELHLRCIVASLRLLSLHGIQPGTGTINYGDFEKWYKQMTNYWQQYHDAQVQNMKDTLPNYNNEFLIVYARDLISTLPNDRSLAGNITNRVVAAVTCAGHAVHLLTICTD
jgi:hypothetical protein